MLHSEDYYILNDIYPPRNGETPKQYYDRMKLRMNDHSKRALQIFSTRLHDPNLVNRIWIHQMIDRRKKPDLLDLIATYHMYDHFPEENPFRLKLPVIDEMA